MPTNNLNFTLDDLKTMGNIFEMAFKLDDTVKNMERESNEKSDEDKGKLMDEALESMNNIAEMYGELFMSLMDEGFTNSQAFTLVEIYAENILKALN